MAGAYQVEDIARGAHTHNEREEGVGLGERHRQTDL
jgi:hypothetical protein